MGEARPTAAATLTWRVELEDPWMGGSGAVPPSDGPEPRKRGIPNSRDLKSIPPPLLCVLSFRSAGLAGFGGEEAAGAKVCSFPQ